MTGIHQKASNGHIQQAIMNSAPKNPAPKNAPPKRHPSKPTVFVAVKHDNPAKAIKKAFEKPTPKPADEGKPRESKHLHRNKNNEWESAGPRKAGESKVKASRKPFKPKIAVGQGQARKDSEAANIEATAPKPGTPERAKAAADSRALDAQVAAAKSNREREAALRDYAKRNQFYIEAGTSGEVVYRAAFEADGIEKSRMAGLKLARVEPSAKTPEGDIVQVEHAEQINTDGTRDKTILSTATTSQGDTSTNIVNESENAKGVVVLRNGTSETSSADGKVSVIQSIEDTFDDAGKQAEHFESTLQQTEKAAAVSERTDAFKNGVIAKTHATSVQSNNGFDAKAAEQFADQVAKPLTKLRDDKDFDINKDGVDVVIPPIGSSQQSSTTDIEYDENGAAVFQQTKVHNTVVSKGKDEDGKAGSGTDVINTHQTLTWGERGGIVPVLDTTTGKPLVEGTSATETIINSFDPRAGQDGNHQTREHIEQRARGVVGLDGKITKNQYEPIVISSLKEGDDDDFEFDSNTYVTAKDGIIKTDKDKRPIEIKEGDEVFDAKSGGTRKASGTLNVHHEDYDPGEQIVDWVERNSGRISAGLAIAGVALQFIPLGVTNAVGGALLIGSTAFAVIDTGFAVKHAIDGTGSWTDVAISAASLAAGGIGKLAGASRLGRIAATTAKINAGVQSINTAVQTFNALKDGNLSGDDWLTIGGAVAGIANAYRSSHRATGETEAAPRVGSLELVGKSEVPIIQSRVRTGRVYDPPAAGGERYVRVTAGGDEFVQLRTGRQLESGRESDFIVRSKDIAGLTPRQIQEKFALESPPEFVVPVQIRPGTILGVSRVQPQAQASGGGFQLRIIERADSPVLHPGGGALVRSPVVSIDQFSQQPRRTTLPRYTPGILERKDGLLSYIKALKDKGYVLTDIPTITDKGVTLHVQFRNNSGWTYPMQAVTIFRAQQPDSAQPKSA